MKKVMCFGTFDKLHPGHIHYFAEAKKLGDYLIVIIARDENVFKIKGKKTVNHELIRQKEVADIKIVDESILGNLKDRWKVLNDYQSDIIAIGYDQEVDEEKLKQVFQGKVVRITSFFPEKYKSSKIK